MLNKGRATILAAAAAPLVLAACGGAHAQPAAASAATVSAAWHRFAQCVRDHGVPDEPDPTVDDHGHVTFPRNAPRVPDAVVQQCSPILDGVPSQPSPGANLAMRTRFARCMRQQGISDFPDPDSQGRFQLPPSLDQGGSLKASPRWPQVQAAMNGPCRQYDPSGQI